VAQNYGNGNLAYIIMHQNQIEVVNRYVWSLLLHYDAGLLMLLMTFLREMEKGMSLIGELQQMTAIFYYVMEFVFETQ
jgi:hypothetical protein